MNILSSFPHLVNPKIPNLKQIGDRLKVSFSWVLKDIALVGMKEVHLKCVTRNRL